MRMPLSQGQRTLVQTGEERAVLYAVPFFLS